MAFGLNFEAKHRYFYLMDSSQEWGVYIRARILHLQSNQSNHVLNFSQIVNVYKVNDKTPFFVLVYKEVHSTSDHPLMDTIYDLNHDETVISVQTTELKPSSVPLCYDYFI